MFWVLLYILSPNVFGGIGSLNSQGPYLYYLFIKRIVLRSLCPHSVGKEDGACYQRFVPCLEDHPCVRKEL